MEKDFSHKYQLSKLFRQIRNQIAAHAQKGVKCPLKESVSPYKNTGDVFLIQMPGSYL